MHLESSMDMLEDGDPSYICQSTWRRYSKGRQNNWNWESQARLLQKITGWSLKAFKDHWVILDEGKSSLKTFSEMKLEHQEACPGIILFLNRGGKKSWLPERSEWERTCYLLLSSVVKNIKQQKMEMLGEIMLRRLKLRNWSKRSNLMALIIEDFREISANRNSGKLRLIPTDGYLL